MSVCPDTNRPRFDVARIGGAWRIVDPAGQIVGGAHDNRGRALTQRDVLQAEADRLAKRMTRNCLCCANPFESEGIHNRLCKRCACRDDRGAMAIPARSTAKIRRAAQA